MGADAAGPWCGRGGAVTARDLGTGQNGWIGAGPGTTTVRGGIMPPRPHRLCREASSGSSPDLVNQRAPALVVSQTDECGQEMATCAA